MFERSRRLTIVSKAVYAILVFECSIGYRLDGYFHVDRWRYASLYEKENAFDRRIVHNTYLLLIATRFFFISLALINNNNSWTFDQKSRVCVNKHKGTRAFHTHSKLTLFHTCFVNATNLITLIIAHDEFCAFRLSWIFSFCPNLSSKSNVSRKKHCLCWNLFFHPILENFMSRFENKLFLYFFFFVRSYYFRAANTLIPKRSTNKCEFTFWI